MEKIKELIDFFEKNKNTIKTAWNETETRIELINPLFESLGWDVNNNQKLADPFKEVKHEASVKIGSNLKAPDYSFNYGKPLFYLEAKKPSIDIKNNISPSFQLRRYGWTAKMSISILTDFEELAIYDCRIKPTAHDNAGVARVKYYTYDQYIEKWDEIYNFISKEAILRGSLNDYETKQIKGTASIDDDFLDSIENWRKLLAENIAKRNLNLTEAELNFSIQMIIDRIIFLRICEDRGIENYEELKNITKHGNIYSNLIKIFEKADDKYNSGLFHFKNGKERIESPDLITPSLNIDDKILKDIIKSLYYPDCPYELSVISSDVLGNVYERFLGKVITLSKTHKAIIDLKPEVRKAGGVYYTPNYVVDYIVKNTIGETIADKTPSDVEKIKILDPACGSGSFLIEAYQFLLDWHLNYYTTNDPEKWLKGKTPKLFKSKTGLQLTLSERKNILLNNIFGVDIDKNAVEVTKLSLLLKVLEYEGQEIQQKTLFQERILPDLYKNIKCGNSLIGSEYLNNVKDIDILALSKINPFDWDKEFKDIMTNGGFDCVIGNPPYLKERGNQEIFSPVMQSNYKKYHQGKMDYWYYFLHRAIDQCKKNGLIGFITNSYWMNSFGATKLIQRVHEELSFKNIVYFNDIKVFANVSGKHMIHIYQKNLKLSECLYIELDRSTFKKIIDIKKSKIINNNDIKKHKNKISIANSNSLKSDYQLLDDYYEVSQGVVEATDKITKKQYLLTKNGDRFTPGDGVFVLSLEELNKINLNDKEKSKIKKYINSSHVGRYYINFQNEYLLYCDDEVKKNIKDFPNIKKHLDNVKEFITSSNKPYGLHRPRNSKYFESPKLICKGMFAKPEFHIDYDSYYFGFSFSSIIQKDKNYSLEFLLAILNSKFGEHWFKTNGKKRGIGVDIGVLVFRQFPLPTLDFNNPQDKQSHDELVALVKKMIDLQVKYRSCNLDNEEKMYEKQIDSIDSEINKIVFNLYDLSEEFKETIEVYKNNPLPEKIITGDILIREGFKPSEYMGKLIKKLYESQLNNEFDTVEKGLDIVYKITYNDFIQDFSVKAGIPVNYLRNK